MFGVVFTTVVQSLFVCLFVLIAVCFNCNVPWK